MTFSEKLLLLRKQKRLSQEQLAEMLDVSRQSVSKWESQQTLPEPSKLILISQIFNVSIDQLLKDDMPMEGDEERTAANAEAAEPAPAVVKLDMMFCTQCGRENRADSAFCGYCGHPFVSFVADKPESGELTKTDIWTWPITRPTFRCSKGPCSCRSRGWKKPGCRPSSSANSSASSAGSITK